MTVKERQKIERHIVGKFVQTALNMGYSLTVSLERGYDYDDPSTCVLASLDRKAIMDMAFAGDECHIFVHCVGVPPVSDGALNAVGWIHCVFGNDGWDVIANSTVSPQMDTLMVDTDLLINEYADKV